MSSLASAQGSALTANYAATKAYNRVLAEGLWEELRRQGVDVLAMPGGGGQHAELREQRAQGRHRDDDARGGRGGGAGGAWS